MTKRSDQDHLINSDSMSSKQHQIRLCSIVEPPDSQQSTIRSLSTFYGVVVPCCLSMFSVILFLRMGFIIGQAGLYESLAMLVLAYVIILLTILSICAISTNGAVEGGGAYYMISRALGPEFGGAIGLMFFLANVAATALYVFGMVEAITSYFGSGGLLVDNVLKSSYSWNYLYGSVILLVCFVICLVGATIYAKATFIIFLVVMVSISSVIVSFFVTSPTEAGCQSNLTIQVNYTGLNFNTLKGNLKSHTTVDYTTGITQNFITVFAVLFNGCTGIMAGANMSGELKDPSRSIPVGTIAACVVTFLVYLVFMILISASTPRELLQCSYSFLLTINVWPPFVAIGVFFSSMSAALSCLIGASRILQQLSNDDIFGKLFEKVKWTTKDGNPIVAVIMSWLLVQLTLFVGGVSKIAPIVTIFFLFSYAATDLSCLALEWASAPNFRPSFQFFSWHTCLLGFISCVVMMFLIQPIITSLSFVVMLALVAVIHYRAVDSAWGYISQALIFHQVRKYMLMLDVRKEHVKFWRPQILLMVKNPRSCCQLIDFINAIKKSGLYVLGHVSVGHLSDVKDDFLGPQYNHWLNFVDRIGVKAFVELTLSRSVRDGTENLLRLSGLGGMKPNTLVMGFYDDSPQRDTFKEINLFKRKSSESVEDISQDDHVNTITSLFFSIQDDKSAEDHRHNFEVEDYVNIISDALKMKKNVCLARYFDQMNKELMMKEKPYYIDVWAVDLLKPLLSSGSVSLNSSKPSSFFDTTCIFLMQMACVLNMSQTWKKFSKLRIYVVESDQRSLTITEIQEFLQAVRIKADIKLIQFNGASLLSGISPERISYNQRNAYLQSANLVIREQIGLMNKTAVSFLYLPPPPAEVHNYADYVDMMTRLSDQLGPTLFIHGVSHVISV